MKINSIEIEAFRSLYSVRLRLGDFSALVGPNNAGKTNLADALQFLGEVARHGLEVAVSRKGGFENIAFRRKRRTKRPVRFAVNVSLDESEADYFPEGERRGRPIKLNVTYEFAIRAPSESREADYLVDYEQFIVRREYSTAARTLARPPLFELHRRENDVQVHSPEGLSNRLRRAIDPLTETWFISDFLLRRVGSTDLLLPQIRFMGIGAPVFRSIGATRLYQLSPVECRKSGSPTPNPEMDVHGGNLPAVVRYIQRNHEDAWNATLDAMRKIVPELEDIETDFTHDRRLALQFVESGAGRPWASAEVSDGTIQSLALFIALFDPRIPLVLIEEPENSVHPWIVRTFVDACRTAPNKRVLVTTHSPALISYLRPDELTVVWRREGRTEVRPLHELDPQALSLWESGQVNTFDLVDQGFVRQTVPEGFA